MRSFYNTTIKLILLLFITISTVINAGSNGKISGKITDKATGDPIPGANVIITGTTMGAASDLSGEYFILQVPPGTYELKFTMIGYQTVTMENVKVMVDLTTSIDVQLEEKSIELEDEVVVSAKRQVVQKDVTSSVQILDYESMVALPVINAYDAVLLQTGVFFDPIPVMGGLGSAGKGEQRYSVRGGEQIQVNWYLDGVKTATLIRGRADWGSSFININGNSVQEIQVNTGGFNAEYGNVQAAIINTVTKSGSNDYHFSAEYTYGLPGQHHFGNYLYNRKTEKEFIDNTLPDGSLDPAWWTPFRQSQVYDYTKIPDHILSLSLSGPLPLINLYGNDIRFFLSGKLEQRAYVLPHPRDARDNQNLFAKFSYNHNGITLRLGGFYNHEAHSTLQENGDYTNQAKYYRGWGSLIDKYTHEFNLQLTHVLNPSLFYDIKLSSYMVSMKEDPSKYFVYGESQNPTIWGFQRYDGYETEPFDNYTPVLVGDYATGDLSFVGSLSWQIDNSNLIKAGTEFRYNTYDEKKNYRYPSFTADPKYWINRGLMETYHPLQLAFYLQDKMEFESMVLNIGVRFDYFDPNYNWFDQTNLFNLSIDPLFDASLDTDGDFIDSNGRYKYSYANVLEKPRSPGRSYTMISPRIGVSFPITENTLLHFNYGHYYQMPPLDQMFEFLYWRPIYIVQGMTENGTDYYKSTDGDPERVTTLTSEPLKPGKTIMFEVGVKHNFWDFAVLDVTAFYKDLFDQTQERIGLFDHFVYGYDPFKGGITANQAYASFFTGDYSDARGFEITLRSLFSKDLLFSFNYSFSTSTQGRATPYKVFIDKDGNTTFQWDTDVNKRIGIEKSFSRPHILRANVLLNFPEKWTSNFAGMLFKNTSISILYQYISGQAFTYLTPDDPPDTYNNYRFPATQTTDLRIDKVFDLFENHQLGIYLQITNLFNNKNLRSFGDVLFDANAAKNYVEKGIISKVDADGYDISQQTYFDRRRVYLGAKYNF